ncbi:DUF4123 domain-containing protein [Polyangium aurulentum]|uniref:DUF4123 domain-containing protein n=1 Tax=Polyangium aurulentum TaxID=2567896 RepID=UPI00146DAF9D|nr:DUF4123 domain-containing protein [Polyangium aurulentum]UQA58627.1 DUF4123 domain-containing protein [Polyangium aurulentum]
MTEPRLIVEVRYGKLAGKKAVVEPGQKLRVGRTDLADLVIPHDGQMSGVHFELQWDGARCALLDSDSLSGTKLSGRPTKEAEVGHGGWIQAGETDFMVYVEGKTPPPRRKMSEIEREGEAARLDAAARALTLLRGQAESAPLYAVVDGGRERRVLEVLRQHVEPHQSLYDGLQGETLEDVAPYLVGPMRKDSELLERLLTEGFGRRWGIFCTSYEKFVEVRRHFRRFLMVELESKHEAVYFRFYDPAVFRTFWPTCNAGQQKELSEGLEEIFVEAKNLSVTALLRSSHQE